MDLYVPGVIVGLRTQISPRGNGLSVVLYSSQSTNLSSTSLDT